MFTFPFRNNVVQFRHDAGCVFMSFTIVIGAVAQKRWLLAIHPLR